MSCSATKAEAEVDATHATLKFELSASPALVRLNALPSFRQAFHAEPISAASSAQSFSFLGGEPGE